MHEQTPFPPASGPSRTRCATLAAAAALAALAQAAGPAGPPGPGPVETLRQEAGRLAPLYRSELVRRFLQATEALPAVATRRVWRHRTTRVWHSETEAAAMSETARAELEPVELDAAYYYNTRYGSPLAYARPLELIAESGLTDLAGTKVLDFGYGSIGHLRLMASLGAEVVGVEVDPLLPLLYAAPADQGTIAGRHGRDGSLRLVHGQFPAAEEVTRAVGSGYDLIVSKNVLKNGYLHPAEPVDPKRLVHLGVDDETFVRRLYAILKPGGRILIYNLCPAPAPPGKPYIPWADGRSPFPAALWLKTGFRVIAFDRNDDAAARAMGAAMGWNTGSSPMDLEKDLFGIYTLLVKPAS